MFFGFLFLFLVSSLCYCQESNCPEFDPDDECTCRTVKDNHEGQDFLIVSCRNIESETALDRIIKSFRGKAVFELELVNCLLRYLPHDAFVDTTIEVLSIQNSTIDSLSDSSVAFEGLDNNLHLLEIINCSYDRDWDWAQLSNLHNLMEIHVSESDITDLTSGLTTLGHIGFEGFVFQKNRIEALADDAFSPFVFIERLSLDFNEIQEVKRSMFPSPATELRILGLSYNKLSYLPEDLFIDMPRLKSIYLNGNPLQTIHEATFRPIWSQMRLLLFHDTQLSCDCRITWLTKEDNRRKYMHAECEGPLDFKGRLLSNLTEEDLLC